MGNILFSLVKDYFKFYKELIKLINKSMEWWFNVIYIIFVV